ncbi:hypothetical protein CKF54_03085 [Psittacicella hinzii]|uniref:Uncharacterized protein n=1 Tax=Psittacicella hinzii TaxID=2028575 RepID=A0A3A1Y7F3_9GAMM|nr:hypothetical protein [Psittacicella hinzii]RIY33189.1 hypothetical protein CKF54_03085 [Psittacicella hinzii]
MPTHKIAFISRDDNPQARDVIKQLFKGKPNLYFNNLNEFRAYAQQNPQYIYDILQHNTLSSVLDPNEYNQEKDTIKIGFYLIFDAWEFVHDQASLIHITQMIKYHLDGKDVSIPQLIERTTSMEHDAEVEKEAEEKNIDVYVLCESGQFRSSLENNIIQALTAACGDEVSFTLKEPVIRPQIPQVGTNNDKQNTLLINLTEAPFAFPQVLPNPFGYVHVNEQFFASPEKIDFLTQQMLATLEIFTQTNQKFNPLKFILPELMPLYQQPFDLTVWNNMAALSPEMEKLVTTFNENKAPHQEKINVLDPENKEIVLVFLGTDGHDDPEDFVSRLSKFFGAFSAKCFNRVEEFFDQQKLFDDNKEVTFCFLDFSNNAFENCNGRVKCGFYVHLADWKQVKQKSVYNMFVIFKDLVSRGFLGHYINYKYL